MNLFIKLHKVILVFKSVAAAVAESAGEILKCDHSNDSY